MSLLLHEANRQRLWMMKQARGPDILHPTSQNRDMGHPGVSRRLLKRTSNGKSEMRGSLHFASVEMTDL
jgi:hypothetical protein